MEETTTSPVSSRSIGIRYGLILAVISIAYFVILNTAGIDMTQGFGRWSSFIFYIAVIYLAHKYFKDQGDSFMSIGQGVGIGFWISLVSSVISSAFTYVYIKFIDTGYTQNLLDKQREAMEEGGKLSEEQIDQAMSMTSKFMTPEMFLIFGIIGGIIILVLLSLVISLFTKKQNPEAFV